MSLQDSDSTWRFSVDQQLRVDRICDAFELSWQRKERPRIEDYLDASAGDETTQFAELLSLEVVYRKMAGETPSFDEYAERFPTYREVLSDHFELDQTSVRLAPPAIANLESFELVGAGSFGAVWKAWDTSLLRFVAVKTPIQPIPTASERELLLREAQVVARVKHPHIVPVHYAGQQDGRVFIVYEFVAGTTLRDCIRDGPLTDREAARLCEKIAGAIDHIHQLGIVHRDLKPGNVLIDEAGEPHVMDFGLAKLIDAASTIGASGNPLGTPNYMSPEQAAGKSDETDARSDIYSLGVILYELLSGTPVFQGSPREVIHQILFTEPPLLSKRRDRVNPDIEIICHKCLEKLKSDRYGSAAELAADLRRFVNGEPVVARRVPRHIRVWRSLKQHRRSILPGLALSFAMIFILTVWPHDDPPAQRPPAPAPDPTTETWTVHLSTEPTGATVTALRCDPENGEPDLYSLTGYAADTPVALQLTPGRYLVSVSLVDAGVTRTHTVRRSVPSSRGDWPSRSASWELFEVLSEREIRWPDVEIPLLPPPVEMAYVEGTDSFSPDGPDGRRTVSVAPFFVATREFTFGDFVSLRPGEAGHVPDRPAPDQPPGMTMPARYDVAEHFAEVAGCRLLTDLEFAYLARLAADAQAGRTVPPEQPSLFHTAGGSDLDEIPTNPPVRGILTGYAEWTSTWPNSPRAAPGISADAAELDRPDLHRIIRGGTRDCGPADAPRDSQASSVASIYTLYPHVGFRLARTAPPLAPDHPTE